MEPASQLKSPHMFRLCIPLLLALGMCPPLLNNLRAQSPVPDDFNPEANEFALVYSLAVQADGKIVVGGYFSELGGQPRENIGRLNADGTLDDTFISTAGMVNSVAVQSDGKILVGGDFLFLGGELHNSIGRLLSDGTVDSSFDPGIDGSFAQVNSIAVQADGKILVGGSFTTIGGQPRRALCRLNSDGTLDDTFINLNLDGDVYSLAIQDSGAILVGGGFTILAPDVEGDIIGYFNVVRLGANGALDQDFYPDVLGGWVTGITSQPDGRVLLSGDFDSVDGQSRAGLARVNPDGTVDASFTPAPTGDVFSVVLQTDGKILLGGSFTNLNGQPRSSIGRLNANGTLDNNFNPEAGGVPFPYVYSLAIQVDGKVLVGGDFTTLGGQPRKRIARLNNTSPATQTLSHAGSTVTWLRGGTSPEVWRTTFEQSSDGSTWTNLGAGTRIPGGWQKTGVTLPPGRTLRVRGEVDGGFQNGSGWSVQSYIGAPAIVEQPSGVNRNPGESATLNVKAAGTTPLSYQWYHDGAAVPGAVGSSLALPNLSMIDAGLYTVVVSNAAGTVTSAPALLTVNLATLDGSFNPGSSGDVFSLAVQTDGKILVGGSFTNFGGQPRNHIARLNADRTLDGAFNPGAGGNNFAFVSTLALQTDGKILVGGSFTSLGGQLRNRIGRLNADGTPDNTFNPGASGSDFPVVYSLKVQVDGKILVSGSFTSLGGQPRANIGRLIADGTVDSTFNPGADGPVNALALHSDGRIVAGGSFATLGGQARDFIGRLNSDGTPDTPFNPGTDGDVYSLAVQSDGKVLAGGIFSSMGGQARAFIGRLNSGGTLDNSFNPGTDGPVFSLALQSDGRVFAGGAFSTLGGQPRQLVGRLNPDGTLDGTFSPGADGGIFPSVLALGVQPDGKILIGGQFSILGGQARDNIGRLNNTDPATQALSYNSSTITWLRGGTSPEVWHTTFEHSTDGSNWTLLGSGERIPGGWQLAGISLSPTGTLRALGRVAGDPFASGWFVETILDPNSSIHLSLVRNGSSVVLGWTGGQGPYQVQQTTDTGNPNSWQDLGAPVPTNSVSFPIGPQTLFLRVRGH